MERAGLKGGIAATLLGTLVGLAPAAALAACPTAENVAQGFAIDSGSAASEVHHIGEHFVQAKTRYSDGVTQTDLYHDGLLPIARVSQRGATMTYQAGLEDWSLEMKKGAKASVTYIPLVDGSPHAETTVNFEVKGSETLKLGDCSYEVFVISETRSSGQSSRQYDQLYSPLLKFVIARRYPDGETKAYRSVSTLN